MAFVCHGRASQRYWDSRLRRERIRELPAAQRKWRGGRGDRKLGGTRVDLFGGTLGTRERHYCWYQQAPQAVQAEAVGENQEMHVSAVQLRPRGVSRGLVRA